MQVSSSWSSPTGTLGGIVAEARERARDLAARAAELERLASSIRQVPPFAAALRGPDVAIIAEVKRRSPSKGWIQASLDARDQARQYREGGAAAISVLTEPRHFAGSAEDLVRVRQTVPLATLKKDFHVAPIQLVEAKALGASAALIIARALPPLELREMLRTAAELRLEVLLEVRDEHELALALELDCTVIGINNRDLETLSTDPTRSEQLLGQTPGDVVAVAESGVSGREDVERLAQFGADAVLVGSTLSAAPEPASAVRALTGIARAARGS